MGDSRAGDDVLYQAAVTASASVSVPLPEIDQLRTQPGAGAEFRPNILKALRNADEQTVAGLVALLRALAGRNWSEQSFVEWGAIGAPRFLGRMIIGGLLPRYFEDAKYSINPHIIPNHSLHSPSGTASVSFGMRGPNFGVGGGPEQLSEGLLTALSVLQEGRIPGIWLIATEFDPEPSPDRTGAPTNLVQVHAVALAIQPMQLGMPKLQLCRGEGGAVRTVADLSRHVSGKQDEIWECAVNGLGVIRWERSEK